MASNYTPEQVVDGYQNGSSTSDPNLGPNGNVSLRQLNWHSDGFTAPASFLEFIQAVKVDEDGSYYFTNLGNLLLQMQQGGDLTSLKTEILRELNDDELDSKRTGELLQKIYNLQIEDWKSGKPAIVGTFEVGNITEATHDSFEGKMSTVKGIVDNESGSKFFPAKPIQLSDKVIFTLNGVVQSRSAYDYIQDPTSGFNVGINFVVAPEENSVVELYVAKANTLVAESFTKAIDANTDLSSKTQAAFDKFESDYNSEITKNDASKTDILAKIEVIKGERDSAQADYEVARIAIDAATNAAVLKVAGSEATIAWAKFAKGVDAIAENEQKASRLEYLGEDANQKYSDATLLKDQTLVVIANANSSLQGTADTLISAKSFYDAQTPAA
jgi:hypothetical protein